MRLTLCLALRDGDSLEAGGNIPSLAVVLVIPSTSTSVLLATGRSVWSLSDKSDSLSLSLSTELPLVAFWGLFGEVETFATTTEKLLSFVAFRRL